MRQGQQNRRNRSRGRSNRSNNNPLSRNYESNGPEVKIKGSAAHIAEKYMTLARDALSSGNTVTAENFFQHAEHYNRIIQAAQAKKEEQAASQVPNKPQRSTDRHPPKAQKENVETTVKAEEVDIPGSGEQPVINGNGASEEKPEAKPKRKPRPRKPKVAKSEAKEDKDTKVKAKDEPSNIVV